MTLADLSDGVRLWIIVKLVVVIPLAAYFGYSLTQKIRGK